MLKFNNLYQRYCDKDLVTLIKEIKEHTYERCANILIERWLETNYIDGDVSTISIGGYSAKFNTHSKIFINNLIYAIKEEKPVLEDFLSELNEEDVFWDVGAHNGIYSVFSSNILDDDNIYSFEPNPDARNTLINNFDRNQVKPNVIKYALSNSSGEIQLKRTQNKRGGRGTINTNNSIEEYNEFTDEITVEQISGDDLIKSGAAPPDVMKIDVEGSEGLVLEGLSETLLKHQTRLIYLEIHRPSDVGQSVNDFGFSVTEVEDILHSYDYELTELKKDSGNVRVKAVLNT